MLPALGIQLGLATRRIARPNSSSACRLVLLAAIAGQHAAAESLARSVLVPTRRSLHRGGAPVGKLGRLSAMRGGADATGSGGTESDRSGTTGFAFYDLDGTIYDGTMAHCVWWFICALPSPAQRISKALQFLVTIPAVGITAIVNEATAASALAMVALKGVSSDDAKLASRAISEGVSGRIYPEVLEQLKEQQRQGKRVTVISGNLAPLIEHFCNELGCDVIATDMEEHGGKYSGLVCGDVCIGEEKRIRLRKLLEREGSEGPLGELVGVGNSKYDIPFLEEVGKGGGKGCVIRPSKRLKKVANAKGWNVLPVRAPSLGRLLREAVWRTSSSMEAVILLFWGGLAAFMGGGGRNFKESK